MTPSGITFSGPVKAVPPGATVVGCTEVSGGVVSSSGGGGVTVVGAIVGVVAVVGVAGVDG